MTKKLGFGLMRLPSLDKNDPSKVDIEQVKQMVDTFLEKGFSNSIQPGCIVGLQVKMQQKKHW